MFVRLTVAVVTVLLLAACGSTSDEPDTQTQPPPTQPAPTDPTLTATPGPDGSTSPATRITGVVGGGDESGCLTLTTTGAGRTTWVLVGQTAGLTPGDRVTVRGSPAPDLATRCQQGTPFVVETVEPG